MLAYGNDSLTWQFMLKSKWEKIYLMRSLHPLVWEYQKRV